jgi:hypothetical protein
MSLSDRQAYILLTVAFGILALLWLFGVILCREWVKNDLRNRCLRPLSVSWRPFAWWGGYYGCCFVVRYLDLEDLIHEARCWTGGFKRGVTWSWDEIVSHDDP